MLYIPIDEKPNLFNYNQIFSKGIVGLGLTFTENAKKHWDASQALILSAALREIEKLENLVEAFCVDADNLCFCCYNKGEECLTIKLHPAVHDDQFPAIAVSKRNQTKMYEVAYISSTNQLYLNLRAVCIKYSPVYDKTRVFRRITSSEAFIGLYRFDCAVEIKVRRPRMDSLENFLIPDEERFLRELVALQSLFNPEGIWEAFKNSSQINLNNVSFQMEFFKLSYNNETDKRNKEFVAGIEIKDGQKFPYFSMDEKHACEASENEQRILSLCGESEEAI
jgi:hypothetical protein